MALPNVHKHIRGLVDPIPVQVELDADNLSVVAIEIGELVALEGGYPVAPADFTWDTDEATTQAAFIETLLGTSADRVRVGDLSTAYHDLGLTQPLIYQDGTHLVYVENAAYTIGDYIGPAQDGVTLFLKNQCAIVATKDLAAFVVVEDKTTTAQDPFVQARLINTTVKR